MIPTNPHFFRIFCGYPTHLQNLRSLIPHAILDKNSDFVLFQIIMIYTFYSLYGPKLISIDWSIFCHRYYLEEIPSSSRGIFFSCFVLPMCPINMRIKFGFSTLDPKVVYERHINTFSLVIKIYVKRIWYIMAETRQKALSTKITLSEYICKPRARFFLLCIGQNFF